MNKQTVDTVASIFTICFGLVWAIFCKALARKTFDYYRRAWPFRVPFGEWYWVVFLVMGIAFVIIGSLEILKII